MSTDGRHPLPRGAARTAIFVAVRLAGRSAVPLAVLLAILLAALALANVGCNLSGPSSTSAGSSTTSSSSRATTGGAATTGTPTTSGPGTSQSTATTAPPLVAISTPKGTISLSTDQLAGQRIIYSYTGPVPPDELFTLISNGEVAGVIFFADNISTRDEFRSVVAEMEAANESAANPVRAPLLLMTDQEGGSIRRLPGAPDLSQKEVGLSDDPAAAATAAGKGAGSNLKGAGLNVNLAPVLDVYRQAGDFEDRYGRSYSKDPVVVAVLGADFIKAQQAVGVAATAKHFPGLGAAAAAQNTDLKPVTLDLSLDSLRSVDEAPYKAAIAAHARLVMVSWAVYPAIDPDAPAGLSTKVVQGELRGRLHFQGVTITDGLGAGALDGFGGFGPRSVRAARAGMDLMLCSAADTQSIAQGDSARGALAGAFRDKTLGKAGFVEAVQRVVDLRYSFSE
jgi:beta-N-acetylhexosaminidase